MMKQNISTSKRNGILSILLVLPMVSHWILPDSIETRFYLNILGLIFYVPNICYFFYIFLYSKGKYRHDVILSKITKFISVLLFCYATFQLISLLGLGRLDEIANILLCNFSFVYFPAVFLCFPLSSTQIDKSKGVIAFAAVFLSLQIILYGLGILTYTSATGNDLTNEQLAVAGVFRVSTTAGAATGTAAVICLLGILLTSFYKFSEKTKVVLFVTCTIAIFLSMSRGAAISWSLYALLLLYSNYIKKKKSSTRIKAILVAFFIGIALFYSGVFNPIYERTEQIEDITTGRESRFEAGFDVFMESSGFGVGAAQVFPDKSISKVIHAGFWMAPHNTYLIYLAEMGILGFLLIIFLYYQMAKRLKYDSAVSIMFLVVLLINLNTEGCFVNSEFLALFFFYYVCANSMKYFPRVK